MVSKKGKLIYAPPKLLDEIENVKCNYEYIRNTKHSSSEALKKIAEFVPAGIGADNFAHKSGLYTFIIKRRKGK